MGLTRHSLKALHIAALSMAGLVHGGQQTSPPTLSPSVSQEENYQFSLKQKHRFIRLLVFHRSYPCPNPSRPWSGGSCMI
jgi:hypothetical protein